jgi:hypothetical protein
MPVVISKGIASANIATTVVTDVQVGGATQKAPEWAKEFLGFKCGGAVTTPTTAEANAVTFRVGSNDFACYPSTVPHITGAGALGGATSIPSMQLEYWSCDWPIHGGDSYDIYAAAPIAQTSAQRVVAATWFGDGEGIMPSREDPYPHVPKFHLCDAATATASTTQALPAYTITGAKAIIQLNGYINDFIVAASRPEIGRIQLNSNGFFTSPVDFHVEPINGFLGAATGQPGPAKISRADVMIPCSPTTIINPLYYQDNTTAVTTSWACSGVTFIR